MLDYLFQMSDINLFMLLSFFSIVVSIIGIFLVKCFISINLRYKDNEVIGNTGALISVIYGVLAGLSALYLINNNNYASDAVQREANAVADIYRDSKWLDDPAKRSLQAEIKKYLTLVINVEWPLMSQGSKINYDGDAIVEDMSTILMKYHKTNSSDMIFLNSMLTNLKMLYDARQQRIRMSYSSLSPEIWYVILIGTVLTLCINYLFGMNFYLHIITVVAAALMTSSVIFLLVALDKPFQGEFVIGPDAFQSIMTFIDQDKSGTNG